MTITKSGELASFYTVNKAPIKHLRVYFSPKQAGEGDPSPENIRPIEGWNNIEITHTGKNIGYMFVNPNGYLNWPETTYYNGTSGISTKIATPHALYGKTVRYSALCDLSKGTDNSSIQLGIWSQNKELKYTRANTGQTAAITAGEIKRLSPSPITLTENIDYYFQPGATRTSNSNGKIGLFQLEFGTEATEFEPYKGQTNTIDWSNNVGTIYGGYVDLVTGELVQEYEFASLTWGQAVYSDVNETTGYQWGSVPFSNPIIVAGETGHQHSSYCNIGQYSWSGANKAFSHFYTDYSDSLKTFLARVIVPSTTDSNLTINCVAKLKTPIIHQLTSQQLETLIGHNNIWSNADRVEVEYDLAESNDELYRRRNIILQSSPHIETATGSIATFQTDMQVPLKSCKVYFNPIQEGEGDPSPDNVRPISGWTGCEVYRTGKNLFPVATGTELQNCPNVNNNTKIVNIMGLDPSESYTFQATWSAPWETEGGRRIYINGESAEMIRPTTGEIAPIHKSATVNPSSDGTIFITANRTALNDASYAASIVNMQLEVGTTATSYEPYNGITIPITFPSEAGTVYGGYIDLKTGEIWETYSLVEIAKRTWNNYSGFLRWYINLQDRKNGGAIISDSVTPDPSGRFTEAHVGELTYYGEPRSSFSGYMWLTTPTVMTYEEANEWIRETYNDATVVYELSAPKLVATLTPTQLKTLRGTNNIWSNANGNIQLSYWKH